MKTLMEGMNIAYDEKEKTRFSRAEPPTALALTLFLILGLLVALAAIVAAPALLGWLGLGERCPDSDRLDPVAASDAAHDPGAGPSSTATPRRVALPKWRRVSPGAILATGPLDRGLGRVSCSMSGTSAATTRPTARWAAVHRSSPLWLWLSAFVVLLGAANSNSEARATRRTKTTHERASTAPRARRGGSQGRTPTGASP